jgi:methyl-accepting chemotaxis protein
MHSFSISSRINVGFASLIALVAVLSALAFLTMSSLVGSFERYKTAAKQEVSIHKLGSNLFQARLSALDYLATSSPQAKETVRIHLNKIAQNEAVLDLFVDDPALQASVTEIIEMTTRYASDFNNLATAKETADKILAQGGDLGRQTREQLVASAKFAEEIGDAAMLAKIFAAQETFLVAGFHFRAYITEESPQSLTNFKKMMTASVEAAKQARAAINAALPTSSKAAGLQSMTDAVASLEEFAAYAGRMETAVTSLQSARDGSLSEVGPTLQAELFSDAEAIFAEQVAIGAQAQSLLTRIYAITPIILGFGLLFSLVMAVFVARWISKPLSNLSDTTQRLANGETDVVITGAEHDHELGRMAQSLEVFKNAHIERDRVIGEREEKARSEQRAVVDELSKGLQALAKGHLNTRVKETGSDDYEVLCRNFNHAVERLETTMAGVIEASRKIEINATDVSKSSKDLSNRTENQAATLEETAAALDQLTDSVKSSAKQAKEVETTVNVARTEAKDSGAVVSAAVKAMNQIESSSQQISQITDVISDISFQTNLLALNAGVEAARAGDAGRGFAVVASEVRALAERSTQAAREVSELISNSSEHVGEGTKLVNQAGLALTAIIDKVDQISELIGSIAENAVVQASGISEINVGVNQLDQVTQQNAGMVEGSYQQGQRLLEEATTLDQLVKEFKLSSSAAVKSKPKQTPAAKTVTVETEDRQIEPQIDPQSARIAEIASKRPKRKFKVAVEENTNVWEDF